MTTITATVSALLPSYYTVSEVSTGDPAKAVNKMMFYTDGIDGYMKIGTAQITITIDDEETIVTNQIAILKEAKKKLQADTQAKITAIDEQIGRLLCLEHKPAIDQ